MPRSRANASASKGPLPASRACFAIAVQSASAIDGISMTAVWIPSALAAISMVIMQVYPISDKHVTDINRQLDEIRV